MKRTRIRLRIALGLLLIVVGCKPPIESSPDSHPTITAAFEDLEFHALGRPVTAEEIAAWNIDVMPDGEGLPEGSGTVEAGRILYAQRCLRCHGAEGRGGPFDPLAGRLPNDEFPFALEPLKSRTPHTIGNYWPWATTIFDYTRRAMPLDRPGSLDNDEVYALTAYLLYLNDLLEENSTLDHHTLPEIVMPARNRFISDDRRGGPEIR